MEIKTLKDLKIALGTIPEKELENFGFNYHDEVEEVQLLYFSSDDREDAVERFIELEKKYPNLIDIDNWIRAIIQVGIKSYEQEIEEPSEEAISSKDLKESKSK